MSHIRILSETLANQVAAGEVIERPASVVKELVENSLDAKASRIQVDFSRGGAGWIRVSDNGIGMDREDALLSLERHGTSKIRTSEDLSAIDSLGFRGEAIPSIASVSIFRLATRRPQDTSGVEVMLEGGKKLTIKECGMSEGTTVEVRSLFFNVPARRKFLKAEATESAHVRQWMETMALAHPEVSFLLRKDGDLLFQVVAVETLGERIHAILGVDVFRKLREIPKAVYEGIHIHGYVGQAGEGRRDRSMQFLFVNGRPIREATLRRALEEAYHRLLPALHYPMAILFLEIDPGDVDCNVHPSKREVRFRNPMAIRNAMGIAIAKALKGKVTASHFPSAPFIESEELPTPTMLAPVPSRAPRAFLPEAPAELIPNSTGAYLDASQIARSDPDFLYRGRLGTRYALLESNTGLVILDMLAASQRLWYEKLLHEFRGSGVQTQRLLLPEVVELSARDHDWISQHGDLLQKAGFGVEDFGATAIKVDSLPALISDLHPSEVLLHTLSTLRETGLGASQRMVEDMIAKSVSYLAPTPSMATGEQEVRRLVCSLFQCELPYACPRGNPTLIEMSFSEIDRKFGKA